MAHPPSNYQSRNYWNWVKRDCSRARIIVDTGIFETSNGGVRLECLRLVGLASLVETHVALLVP